jgi:hypothetical protein
MSQQKIEGIPDGWELVRIGKPEPGEWVVSISGDPIQFASETSFDGYAIIRKIEKPKEYRPFANAAEFAPHRDRWISRSYPNDKDEEPSTGCFKATAYDDSGIWTGSGESETYERMLDDDRRFDDGTPFGVEVVE